MTHSTRWTVALAAAATATLALSACTGGGGGGGTDVPDEWTTSTAAAAGPVDEVAWNLPYGEPVTLHWLRSAGFSESTVLSTLCESLLRVTPEFGYEPGLATVEQPDDTTYVYTLQDGVVFSNGDPVTADDVVYSLSQNLDYESGSFWSGNFGNVESITATGDREVTVQLTQPDALFNQIMATSGAIVVQQSFLKAAGEAYGTSQGGVMCTGPFQLDEWVPGDSIRVSANPNYWDAAHQPQAGAIDFSFVTNAATLTDALRTGEIDGSYEVPFTAITTLSGSDAGTLTFGTSLSFAEIVFFSPDGVGVGPDVRRALSLAIDREAVAESIFNGAARPIWSPFFESIWGEAADVYKAGYDALGGQAGADLDAARDLVEGADPGRSLRLLSNADDPAAKALAAYIKSQAGEIGLDVELVELPAAQYIAVAFDPERQLEYDMSVGTTSYIDIADPTYWAGLVFASSGYFNGLRYNDPEVDSWILEAQGTLDPVARAEIMVQVQERVYGEDQITVPIVQIASVQFMNSRITGANPTLNAHFYYPWARDLGATG
jgi:peptide/nickel transport system substrate-binding protein